MCDQIARLEDCFALRRVPRQNVKVRNRNTPLALRSPYVNGRLQGGHGHIHVGWVCRNAMFARPENSQTAVCSSDRRAARSGLTLVARHIGSAEIHAARPLQEVASSSRHVPKLDRRTTKNRFGKDGVILTNERVVSQIRVANDGTNC